MPISEPISIGPAKSSSNLTAEAAVRQRYSQAASVREELLCCPVDYDAKFLEAIPAEVIERDYGCGDPSKHVRTGETVLDLGSGGGKICFIASQVVGTEGHVIGVDMNDDMLELARRSQPIVAERIGYNNIQFLKGKIQDLAVDRDIVGRYLTENPVRSESDLQAYEAFVDDLRANKPMIADESIDVVVSNCVLNLVDPRDKDRLFEEIFRVLKPGGRAVISDVVCDQEVPEAMRQDPELWSGCISGAFEEPEFLHHFANVGFENLEIAELSNDPWQVVQGIEFRSMTVIAHKPAHEVADHDDQAAPAIVMYRGPFAAVMDDANREYARGHRVEVDPSTFDALMAGPLGPHFTTICNNHAPAAKTSCGPGCC